MSITNLKTPARLAMALILAGNLSFLPSIHAQTIPSLFVVVDFMKVKPENHSKYLEVEQEIWKPLHQKRIDEGILVGWYLYAVEFSGTDNEYNYVVINLYDNVDNLETPWKPEIPARVHRDKTLEEIMNQTYDSRENVKTELYYSIATAPEIPLEIPASYLEVNYMQVEGHKQSEYELLESEIWLPIHNESIQKGRTTGWGLWKGLFPRGTGQKHQYITLNTFSKYSYIFELDFSIPFKSIHPDKDYAAVLQRTREARTIVRTELWDLIDYAIR